MMKALLTYLLAGKLQAAGVISVLTVLSLLLPPFSYIISGTPVSLITLRKGPYYAIQVMAVALALTSLFGYFTALGVVLGAAYALGIWSPLWVCSTVLRWTESQGQTTLAAAITGILVVLGLQVFSGELTDWWQAWFDEVLQQGFPAAQTVQLREMFDATLPLISGIIASGLIISLMAALLLARWCQSHLFNPGGFRQEFHQLLLPRWLTVLTLICLVGGLVDVGFDQWLVRNLLLVLIVTHMFQGIASIHRVVFKRRLSRGWLVAMYGFLLFLPQTVLFLACIGMADIWIRHGKSAPVDK
jgi:hypothetical protein